MIRQTTKSLKIKPISQHLFLFLQSKDLHKCKRWTCIYNEWGCFVTELSELNPHYIPE